jgi:predicted esterase
MQIHHLTVSRTARIYSSGPITPSTRFIWLAAHGYGMLGQYFIKKFDPLPAQEHVVLVPEALSRFYSEGLTGKIGASWMTAEDRDNEIKDYIAYLDEVYERMISPFNKDAVKIIALGFSQGSTAIFRWANTTKHQINHLIGWGGSIPEDVLSNWMLQNLRIQMLIGDKDPFIPLDQVTKQLPKLRSIAPQLEVHIFNGGHQILPNDLLALAEKL